MSEYNYNLGAKTYAASNSLYLKKLTNITAVGKYSSNAANTMTIDAMSRISINSNDSTGYRSLIAFLNNINNFGVQVQNNFEVEFDGIEGITLFVNSFELPGSKLNTCEIFYDGIKIQIPINYEHDHEFSMTIINDAQGFIYSAIKSYIELDSYNHYTKSKNNMRVKALTGQVMNFCTDSCILGKGATPLLCSDGQGSTIAYQGSMIICYGVRLTSISGLAYGQSNNDILTFTVQGTMIEYSHLPLGLSKQVSHSSI